MKRAVRSKRTSELASERANGRASGPVLMSLFLFVPHHSGLVGWRSKKSRIESREVGSLKGGKYTFVVTLNKKSCLKKSYKCHNINFQ